MHSLRFALLLGALLAPLAAVAADKDKPAADKPAATGGKIIAKVNGAPILQSRFDVILKSQTAHGQQDTPEFREELRDVLITREVLAQEALKRKIDKDPMYLAQLDVMKQQILLTLLFEDFMKKSAPTEEAIHSEYERVKADAAKSPRKEYKARHILVKEEADAKAIIEQLQNGADFAALAKEKSIDPGSKDNGGELEWSEADHYVGPFGDALKSLKKGETTKEPVHTSYGYHVIQLADERPVPFPEYDRVKTQIRDSLVARAREDFVTKLREKAKIEKTGSLTSN